jgi:arylsulfatase
MKKKPNILMVLADQHNANHLGFMGHKQALTPRLDEFASQGTAFSRAYASNTICTPSRVSILSGQYCHNHGYYGLSGPTKDGMDNLFRHCKKEGYRTAGYGKLHLPIDPRHWLENDLDYFGDAYETSDGWIGKSEYFDYLTEKGLREKEDSWHNTREYSEKSIALDCCPSKLPYEDTMEMWCARKAMEFIKEDKNKPFCIQVALQRPHHPSIPQKKFWDLYPHDIELPHTLHREPEGRPPMFREKFKASQNRIWEYALPGEDWEDGARRHWRGTLACVTQMDDVFGQLMDFLDKEGLTDNTIVLYGSDHGGYHGIFGIEEKAPGICSDQVCRVPMIWRGPGIDSKGKIMEQLVENTDISPTLLSLCGLDPMDGADGLDISLLLQGQDRPVHTVAVTENAYSKSINFGEYRLVHYPESMFNAPFGELYNMKEDPMELNNLYFERDYQELVQRGKSLLLDWLISTTRVVTTQPAPLAEESIIPERYDDPRLLKYEILSDGTAPNKNQPRFRKDMNKLYL